jgi:hypothetical protein
MAFASVKIILHFAGYRQIFHDITRLDETVAPRPRSGYDAPRSNYDHPITLGGLQGDVGACYEA